MVLLPLDRLAGGGVEEALGLAGSLTPRDTGAREEIAQGARHGGCVGVRDLDLDLIVHLIARERRPIQLEGDGDRTALDAERDVQTCPLVLEGAGVAERRGPRHPAARREDAPRAE